MLSSLTIDCAALRANVTALGGLVRPARYWAVVKANAYGHGLIPTAPCIADLVAGFCVYRLDEAIALRGAGIRVPILVLGPVEPGGIPAALAGGAALTIWNQRFARAVAEAAARTGSPAPIHVKIDTGVTRLGFDVHQTARAIADFLQDDRVAVRGVFTHLAAAEELESDYTLEQLERFERALAPVAGALSARGVLRHAAASAAAMLYPALRLDAVRAGIATYGIWPSPQTRAAMDAAPILRPALTWTTKLVVVRDVEAGRSVGYGCTFRTARPSRIGVLPIGYAEGVPRALSPNGVALVRGRRVPFVGRICMNMSFVDVTDVPDVASGATVTLIGSDGDVALDANDMADAAGTIGYEIVARLPAEMPRRYLDACTEFSGPADDLSARSFAATYGRSGGPT